MPLDDTTTTDPGPDTTDGLTDFLDGSPEETPLDAMASPNGEGPTAATDLTPPLVAPVVEEFDIDGRKVNRDALFQTYRQFSHLQQRHQEVKPYLDLMQEIGLTSEQIPQFRAWVAAQINGTAAPARQDAAPAIEQQPWFQEIAETFPEYAKHLLAEIEARQSAEARFTQLEETLGGFTGAIQDRQRQEQAVGILGTAADHINGMMEHFPRLQDPEVRGAFLRWLWDEQQPGAKIADPKFLRGMYMVYDEAALAEQWEAKATASRSAHAATVARGFAETGAPRAGASPSKADHAFEEFLRD